MRCSFILQQLLSAQEKEGDVDMKIKRKKDRKRMTAKIWILAALIGVTPTYAMISNAENGRSVKDDTVLGEGSLDRDKSMDPKQQGTGVNSEIEDYDAVSDVDIRPGDVGADKEKQEGQEDAASKEQKEGKEDGKGEETKENVEDSQEKTDRDADIDKGNQSKDSDLEDEDMDPDEDADGGNTMPDAVLSDGSKAPILEEERSPEEEMVKEEDQIKDLPVIIAFDELDIREYRFSEKPELEMLLEKFPKWLDAVAQKGYTDPEQEEDAPPDLEESQDEDKTSHKRFQRSRSLLDGDMMVYMMKTKRMSMCSLRYWMKKTMCYRRRRSRRSW